MSEDVSIRPPGDTVPTGEPPAEEVPGGAAPAEQPAGAGVVPAPDGDVAAVAAPEAEVAAASVVPPDAGVEPTGGATGDSTDDTAGEATRAAVGTPSGEQTGDATGDRAQDTARDAAELRGAAEAVLLVVDTPITTVDMARVLDLPLPRAEETLRALRDDYDASRRGFTLREVAGGWRLYTRQEYAPYVERYVVDGQQARLTQAALETLAVVAYRQPVTRSRIAAIRGVGVDGVMRTLLTRGLVEECGTVPETGGNLYRTTPLFLEKLGLQSLDELPSLAPLLPEIDAVDDVATSA